MAARPKKAEPAHDEVEVPGWVSPDDHEKYVAAHNEDELDAAGFRSREEYEGRTEMNKIAAAPPAAEPGDANYDWSQHYPKGANLYVHQYPDGQTVALRRFSEITSKQWMLSVSHLRTDFDIENAAMERGSCPEAITLIRLRPAPIDGPDDFQDLWNAWTADSNDDGEAASAGE